MGILRTNEISGLETPTPVTGSVSFDGNGDYLSLADSNDWFYSTGNFTIEFWYYFNALPDSDGHFFYSQRVDGGNYVFIYANSTQGWVFDSYSSSVQGPKVTASTSHTTGVWKHLAVVRNNNTFTIYIDGIGSGTSSSSSSIPDLSAILELGRWPGGPSRYVNGYISNLRILKGTALYTSNFTPPVHELQPIGDTVLLCCNSSTSATAEATGKTITVNGNAAASTFSPGLTRDFTYGTQFQGVAKFDTQGYFVPPSGTTAQRYPNDIVRDGLVLYLDAGNSSSYSGTGTTWVDLSGRGNHGTLVNGVSYTEDNEGALVFDGVDDYVNCGTTNLSSDTSLTVEVWVKPGTTQKAFSDILDYDHGSGGGFVIQQNNLSTNQYYFAYWNGTTYDVTSTITIGTSSFNHLVFTKSGTSVVGYLNSQNTLNYTGSSVIGLSGRTLNIGRLVLVSGREFNGNISSVKIYNKALSASEVLQNYNALKGRYGHS